MQQIRKIALGLVILIAVAGAALIIFNILDFKIEGTRIHPPSTMIFTLPVAAAALAAAVAAARAFTVSSRMSLLWLGCGALAFALGNIGRSWGAQDMNTAVTVKNCADLLAAVLFLTGVSLSLIQRRLAKLRFKPELKTVLWYYLGVAVVMGIISVLAASNVMPPFYVPGCSTPVIVRDVQDVAVALSAMAACFSLKIYSASRERFSYWYALGLVLFTLALFFGSQSSVDSVLSWLARVAEFITGIFLFTAAQGTLYPSKEDKSEAVP
jgi:hypothetical protein